MFNNMECFWVNEPRVYEVKDDCVRITTMPGSDFWQRTYYGFKNDNAHGLLFRTSEKYFSFTVKTEFTSSHHRFDQCGVLIYQNSDNWLKASIEYENEEYARLGSVVTNNGYSDWATTDISAEIKSMYYRLSRRESDFCIENSQDGINFRQMRIAHLFAGADDIDMGIYACSPEDSSFEAVFTEMDMGECKWEAHK